MLVNSYANLRQVAGSKSVHHSPLAEAAVQTLLDELLARFPALCSRPTPPAARTSLTYTSPSTAVTRSIWNRASQRRSGTQGRSQHLPSS